MKSEKPGFVLLLQIKGKVKCKWDLIQSSPAIFLSRSRRIGVGVGGRGSNTAGDRLQFNSSWFVFLCGSHSWAELWASHLQNLIYNLRYQRGKHVLSLYLVTVVTYVGMWYICNTSWIKAELKCWVEEFSTPLSWGGDEGARFWKKHNKTPDDPTSMRIFHHLWFLKGDYWFNKACVKHSSIYQLTNVQTKRDFKSLFLWLHIVLVTLVSVYPCCCYSVTACQCCADSVE